VINNSKAEFKELGQKTNTKLNYINQIKMYRQHVALHNVMEHAAI